MQLTGNLRVKKETQKVSDRFTKREFVLEDNSSQYPQFISFQLTQDKCNLLDNIQQGDTVTVHFNIRGREWKSPQGEIKYFNTLEAWKLDSQGGSGYSGQSVDSAPADYSSMSSQGGNDDLPF